jgi:integrase
MSVTIRPYMNGGWEADILILLPDGTRIRERKKAPASGKAAAQRWAEARERVLLVQGKPKLAIKEEVRTVPTLQAFAARFVEGYARANRLKPSGIAAKESILRTHLVPRLGTKALDAITTEDVQAVKSALVERSPKTVNNVLTTLSVLLRTAVEWGVIKSAGCSVKLLKTPKTTVSFYDFEAYERLLTAAKSDATTYLIALLGGEAGLRCGEIMAVEWRRRPEEAAIVRRPIRMEGACDDAEGKAAAVCAADPTVGRDASGSAPSSRATRDL